MKVLNPQTKTEIDLNTANLPNADELIGSGQLVPNQKELFTIKDVSGNITQVPGSALMNELAKGSSIFTPADAAAAAEQAKFATLPQEAAAGLTGAARGATLGLSDVALRGLGVSPEYLQKLQKYSPAISTTGEVAGMVAPALLSGGESAVAQALSKTPAALVPELGAAVGEIASPVAKAAGKLSPIASQAVEAAVKGMAGSAVEGAAYSFGKTISEDAIQDKPFTAEAALANMGTGALINGLIGGALGGVGELAHAGAQKVLSKVSQAAEDGDLTARFIARAFGSSKKNMSQLLGNEAKIENVNAVYKAMHSGIDLTPDVVGLDGAKTFARKFEEASQQPISFKNVFENTEDSLKRIATIKEQAGNAIDNALENVESLTDTRDIIKAMDVARNEVSQFDFATQDRLNSYLDRLKSSLVRYDENGKEIYDTLSAKELWQARKAIDDVIYNSKDLTLLGRKDNPFTNALNKGRGEIEKRIEEMVETTDSISYKDYKTAKKAYAGASDLEKLALHAQAKNANNILGLTTYISGGAGAAAFGAPGAVIGMALRQAGRDYGDRAVVSILTNLEKSGTTLMGAIDSSIKGIFTAGKAAGTIATVKGIEEKEKATTYQEKLEKFTDNANSIENVQDRLDKALVGLGSAAPQTALELRNKTLNAMEFLASKLPKQPVQSALIKYQIPESELDKFNRYHEAVNNPMSIIKNIKGGYISPEEVDVLRNVYPEIHQKLQTAAIQALSNKTKEIDYQQRIQLQKLLDNKQEVNMFPGGTMMLQSSFGVPQAQPQGMITPSHKLPGARAKNMNLSRSTDTGLQATLKRRNE